MNPIISEASNVVTIPFPPELQGQDTIMDSLYDILYMTNLKNEILLDIKNIKDGITVATTTTDKVLNSHDAIEYITLNEVDVANYVNCTDSDCLPMIVSLTKGDIVPNTSVSFIYVPLINPTNRIELMSAPNQTYSITSMNNQITIYSDIYYPAGSRIFGSVGDIIEIHYKAYNGPQN
jgi:hypothetical protein